MGRVGTALLLVCSILFALVGAETTLAAKGGKGGLGITRHNLSAGGPGPLKAPGVGQICIFCHTPHNATPGQAMWNRDLPAVTYKLYESSTLEAQLNQPTGASRLCLSCHDGMVALNKVRDPGRTRMPKSLGPLTGRASLGTDLSDDHPISFVYDVALATTEGQLADPETLPSDIRLDETKQLQCTTCHDSHEAQHRKFLRRDDRAAGLCTLCHKLRNWTGSAHATSTATWRGTGKNPWAGGPFSNVAENGCRNCHEPHGAPHPERLLSSAVERAVCLVCHDGSMASKNLEVEFVKFSRHPVDFYDWTHDPLENPATMPRHVTCVDCHNPHQADASQAVPPVTSGPLRGVPGVRISGGTVRAATFEYEVCLKCHGIYDQTTVGILRQDNVRNIRLEIDPGNSSYHPVAQKGRNSTMGGFEPGYTTASLIYCTDCHNSDDLTATGTAPRGPHGSRYPTILAREYEINDPQVESYQTYALCYECHNQDFLVNDRANTFPHNTHVVTSQAPCAACHDAHGSRRNTGLINFMLQDRSGRIVVSASASGRLEFISLGPGTGQCFLMCHGRNHDPEQY